MTKLILRSIKSNDNYYDVEALPTPYHLSNVDDWHLLGPGRP